MATRHDSGPRPLRRGKKTNPMQQYLLIAGIFVALIVVMVLLMTSRKPADTSRAARVKSEEGTEESRSSRRKEASPRASRALRRERKDKEEVRGQRRREREERTMVRRNEERASRRTGSVGSSARVRTSSPYQLRAIMTDESGVRYALVGDRRFRAGDDIGGRKLVEIGVDEVKVDNGISTYSVKVGQTIY